MADAVAKSELKEVVARGECGYRKTMIFERINKERRESGLPQFCQSAQFGRRFDPPAGSKIAVTRHLDSNSYSLVSDLGQATHEQEHKFLEIAGLRQQKFSK